MRGREKKRRERERGKRSETDNTSFLRVWKEWEKR